MLKNLATSGYLLFAFATVASADTEFFESRIRPVLVEQCYACHNSAETAEGDLALDFRQGLFDGGSGGALIAPGDPANSRLIAILKHQVDGLEMPEDSAKLDDVVIADFEQWIANGAKDPRDEPPSADALEQATSWESKLERRKQWWSFQPIETPGVPEGTGNSIDRFVRVKQEELGLSPSKPADSSILIRRLYFALIGLPPTPDELTEWTGRFSDAERNPEVAELVKSFVDQVEEPKVLTTSATSNVTEELVDHLLASKQFGPRWARHWMDWIRYAESHGSEGDPNMSNAWMYRDYLIRSLNDDLPYDQLVREHLAGDLLENPRINEELGLNESLLGAIQLRMVFHGFSPTDALDEKVRFVDDQVNTISKAFLGITVSCARCHDHKFDAISQTDYYAMFGMFAACRPGRLVADSPDRLHKNRDPLVRLKLIIKNALADAWIDSMPTIGDRIDEKLTGEVPSDSVLSLIQKWDQWPVSEEVTSLHQGSALRSWNLADADDFGEWIPKGIKTKPTRPGQFAIALSGDNAIQGIYPAGVYSHLISTKHPLRITSPDMVLDGKYDYWVRAIGDNDAATRYVTQDYPRTGTVYQAVKLSDTWKWRKLKLDYWEGDTAHFELATGPDIPLQASNKMRSWFGATEVRVVKHGTAMPVDRSNFAAAISELTKQQPKSIAEAKEAVIRALGDAILAWRNGECTDSQAELIDHAIRIGLLNNRLDSLTTVKPHIDRYRKLEAEIPTPRRVPGLDDVPARRQPLYVRGNHKQPADLVSRRFLEAIDSDPYPTSESGRRQFAEDILRDDNPLARRVIVNRIWHHMFGKGIVATPDNLGKLGSMPTDPQLLDWLAVRFVKDGWSLKKMIRLIATSQTWQQTSDRSATSAELDPDNSYLSHANVRRLEAEAIRDAMLRASGTIDLAVQSPPVDSKSNLRSVFLRVRRNSLNPMLRSFDFPEPHSAVGRRDVTNVPAQSLLMMNSPLVAGYAAELAKRVVTDSSLSSDEQRIEQLYSRLFSRPPSELETDQMLQHVKATSETLKNQVAIRRDMFEALQRGRQKIAAIIEPKRTELIDANTVIPKPMSVQPIVQWEFENDAADENGKLVGDLVGGARIEGGILVVKDGAHVNTKSLTQSLTSKTLEAWVQLDTLDQRGGGVMTVQTRDGSVFDSIVFAEKEARRWLAGSNGFVRTKSFEGSTEESDADNRFVHVAISYHQDGTVVGYRDGARYGKPYKTSPPFEFKAGEAIVSFGVRHLPNVGNRRLAGRIERAKLYDRALSDDEVAQSFEYSSGHVSDTQVIEALSKSDRKNVEEQRLIVSEMEQRFESIRPLPKMYDPQQSWTDLARTLLTLKEFIYVR